MKILPYAKAIYGKPEKQAVKRVLNSDWLSGHKETVAFEEELAEWWGTLYAVSTNSGSSANFIAMQACGLGEKRGVCVSAGGAFPTTISPILYHNLLPVFFDIDLSTFCMSPYDLQKYLNIDKIRIRDLADGDYPMPGGLMLAHTLGRMPEDTVFITKIAKGWKMIMVEDCCDAMGSEQEGKKAGTFGDMATVSFYPAHLMTTGGEGGAILTNDYGLYRKCRSIRDWGRDCFCKHGGKIPACGDRFKNPPFDHRYYYTSLGLNFKMTEMQAAFGREQLKRVDGFIEKRKRNYKIIQEELGFPVIDKGIVPFAFPILTKKKTKVMKHLAENRIGCRSIFAGNILKHPAYKFNKYTSVIVGDLKNSNRLFNEGVFVGVGPHLTKKDMKYMAKILKEVL